MPERRLAAVPDPEPQARPTDENAGRIELRYVARAGLLPELSKQTYDSFYKALREAVLNSIDAAAHRVDLDFSRVSEDRTILVSDDGTGMTTSEFCDQFMSIGGSTRFGDSSRFGRIGIGSLALLQYGREAVIETKVAGTSTVTRAVLSHRWAMRRDERRTELGDLPAGSAEAVSYKGSPTDHFTRVCIYDVNDEVRELASTSSGLYSLLDDLRRVLPLPWPSGRVSDAVALAGPDVASLLHEHANEWSARVFVQTAWERDVELERRFYGDDPTEAEDWSGPPLPILKTVRVSDGSGSRRVTVAGFLLSQRRASPAWSGITARVQNVAVEERTFFDITTDPGFRKYITGEIWLLGEIDRERLINIDRSSFSRESPDYRAVQRFMSRAISGFKASHVQRPQRQRMQIRRCLESHVAALALAEQVLLAVIQTTPEGKLPRAEPWRGRLIRQSLRESLEELGAKVVPLPKMETPFELDLTEDGRRILVRLHPDVLESQIRIGRRVVRVSFADAEPDDPPVVIRQRPREIIFNRGHPSHQGKNTAERYQMSLALELAYLQSADEDAAGLYERLVGLMGRL